MPRHSISQPVILLILIGAAIGASFLGRRPAYSQAAGGQPLITLALMGDVMLGRDVARAHADGSWSLALGELAPLLKSADLAMANLESPLAMTVPPGVQQALAAGEYNLCAPGQAVQALTSAGLDVLSLANNHTGDCGQGGLAETTEILMQAGLIPLLPGQTHALTVNRLKLALLAFDDIRAALDLTAAAAQVRTASAEGALVIVSMHWGSEYQSGPNSRQEEIAGALLQAGAVLVWGHHPHTLQQVVWQRGGHDGPPFARGTLVAYSLGNGLFDTISPPDARRSAVLLVTLGTDGVLGIRAIPVQISPLDAAAHLADRATAEAVQRRLGMPLIETMP